MGFPLFRVTLDNDIEGSLVISEPGGWDDAKLKLDRNMEFHSLVEFYDQPLMFYGEDNANNGGLNYIRNIEQTQGPDAQITILIEISNDEGSTYEVCVEQTLEIESVKETDFYKAEFGVIRNGFWQNFMNRKGTPVDLLSTTDLDGNARTAINDVTVQLPSQKIRSNFNGYISNVFQVDPTSPIVGKSFDDAIEPLNNGDFVQVCATSPDVVDEIIERFSFPIAIQSSANNVVWCFEMGNDGIFSFNIDLTVFAYDGGVPFVTYHTSGNIQPYIQKNEETPISFTANNETHNNVPYLIDGSGLITLNWTRWSVSNSFTTLKGDRIRIYFEVTNSTVAGSNNGFFIQGSGMGPQYIRSQTITEHPSYFEFTEDSTYVDTETEAFFIHEAGNAVTDRIIGRDGTFYSEYLGNTNTQIQNYAEDGCGSWYALARGLNVRGYSLAEKPFFMSFDTFWNGINPLLNLGLGYETLGSPELEVIRIEPKSYFYNPTTSINFDFVNNIERSYNPEFIFKAIEIGFEKWSAESASGVDDPQSKRVYTTRFKTVGKEIKILSKFIGASLAIEQTRRNRVEQGKDWRLDEDVMIIAMNKSGDLTPELDENFTSITNLLNAETRYNIRLSVARNFERWKDFFNGCLQWYVGEDFKFASGEGNFDMTSTLDGADCEANGTINEKGDIEVTDDFLFMPVVYTFEHPMTWDQYKTIRDNRNNAIGVSRTDENHISCYIMELEYQITHGRAIFTVILGEHNFL